ncbi:FKBP-type peptidyl-prolyl cis-trans isomerase 2 [Desulfosalsimonas propionicica]|uniref:Peptidyl-prolyl cis-trans isomerase n=1 Tax=Desulfosalsimonas propionicica TaxID=332175 RepID=A0A7W0HM26_9BACT|nr:peptidylprolyl isomerase [Desulfosalsimonas propionicica]MBA2882903.1 FKBP-type peptidyl-prolyl cis-trans isomerase 2 [Desulfosalsimonas propionicica]
MTQAKSGDTVKIHYKGKFDDGSVFDSSEGRDPLEFEIGSGNIITGVEEAVVGMQPEETKEATIPPEKGYGEYRDDMVIEVEKTQFPEHIDPEPGQQLELQQPDGQKVTVTVTNVGEEKVTLDANHPLAGKDLNFEITLQEIL